MTKPAHTPAGVDDLPAGTTGPTPSDGVIYEDHSQQESGAVKGGEAEKPGKMSVEPGTPRDVEYDNHGNPVPKSRG